MTDEWPAPPIVEDHQRVADVPRPRVVGLDGRPPAQRTAPPEPDPLDRARLAFAARAARYLAADAGVRQFVDISSGLPTCDAVLEAVGDRGSGVRAVYFDASDGPALHPGASPHRAAAPVVSVPWHSPWALVERLATCGLVDVDEPVCVLVLDTAPKTGGPAPGPELLAALHDALGRGGHVLTAYPRGGRPDRASRALAPFAPLEPGLADIAWWPYPDEDVAAEGSGLTGAVGRREGAR
ncbi:SAM-dependent methyltransferase [Nocardiopsis suaedae]|uniref:SAM-dependent methyltransferase n=1 Tax=Nocardiopsis suaedae TaxID=3018444 RepID=A0ABT4TSK2_9ACTN|nr:SAM-dependent methyltransferase [Nocardiopsis suaedae]MDA2807670.1 SAM-dependent methyltransferase [Nocardiopsis suaedae]